MQKFYILVFLLIITFTFCFYIAPARSAHLVCGQDKELLNGLESKYGERVIEQGIDEQTLVLITANLKRNWTILVTPKNKPHTLCVLATGYHWTQAEYVSKGTSSNGDIISFIHKNDGTWTMMYFDKTVGQVKEITTGYGWERLIDLTKLTGSERVIHRRL
jgi:hypothetical protein